MDADDLRAGEDLTAHAPAIPRLRVDLAGLLARLRRKRRPDPEPDLVILHLHRPVPRVLVTTDEGAVEMELAGACLDDVSVQLHYLLVFDRPAQVLGVRRFIGDQVFEEGRPAEVEARPDGVRMTWVIQWGRFGSD